MRTAVVAGMLVLAMFPPGRAGEVEAAAERGRVALTQTGHLKPGWSDAAYRKAGTLWNRSAPDLDKQPADYAAAFIRRYGLHPAPYPNDGLPMGLRRGVLADGTKEGVQIDCMVCHGGSLGGKSYVGLGNTQLDLNALLRDLTRADGRRLPPSTFVMNSSRGTVNAGMVAAVLLSVRNSDLSFRLFPLPMGTNLPEMDVPPWWHMAKKATMYYDGRTDARSVRSSMQFLLGEKTLEEFQQLEPQFHDILAYFKSLRPPKYPFLIDAAKAEAGKTVFVENCARCHGTYGADAEYPSKVIDLKTIGTDPARAYGLGLPLVKHYNSTWFGADYPVKEQMTGYQAPPLDGIWATAPYLHNGSVPTLDALLKSSERPARFKRPPSTGFEHYDTRNVGWKFEALAPGPLPKSASTEDAQAVFDASRFGLGNQGHTFGDALEDGDRIALIEYLKTL
ncbi:MAG: c-type cytochrome [Isosphaeraceae bacterium]|nr:c-type cytochrome [Isosphaeraceae bacterium]